jgi:transposase
LFITKQRYEFLLTKIEELEARITILEAENYELKHPKNSHNSSIPPSKDENRVKRNQSLRERSGKKPGGQQGHKGSMLEMSETPDEIIKHIPGYCNNCGEDLSEINEEFIESRQVIILPEILVRYIEHQVFGKKCSCGHITKSDFPTGIDKKIQYGNGIASLISYLFCRQYIPFHRMKEMLNDLFHIPISEGGIHYLLQKITNKEIPLYNLIRDKVEVTKQAGSDETGAKINGKKYWFWTWQNKFLTYIVCSPSRGYESVKKVFPKGLVNAIINHDRWASQIITPAKGHQICTAHLLRDFNYLIELYKCEWSVKMKMLILRALELKKQLAEIDYLKDIPERNILEQELDLLLSEQINPMHKKSLTMQKKLSNIRNYILTFLYYPEVPPDNNGSERAIRNIKVKQKVSGYFKSYTGAEIFAINRSIIDTIIKSGNNVLEGLNLVGEYLPD